MSSTTYQPLVSIIIPTYNRANYIAQTIESVRSQTYKNWELIVVDDGSVDATDKVVASFNDSRIQYTKVNHLGIGGAVKNIGIKKLSGELLAFIDSDDLWSEAKLERQVSALQDYPDAHFCLTNGYNFKEISKPVDFFYKQQEGLRFDNLFISCFKSEVAGFTQALMFKRECLHTIGLFKEVKSFSDSDFIVALAKQFKGLILYEPLVYRRLHEDNYIGSTWEKSYYEGIEIIQNYKQELPRQVLNDAMYRLYINFGEDCLSRNKKAMSVYNFCKAWKYHPFSFSPAKKIIKAIMTRGRTSQ